MRKRILICAGSSFASLALALLCLYLFSGMTIAEIAPVNTVFCVPSVRGTGDCCQSKDGDIYTLSQIGLLSKNGEILAGGVTTMQPAGDGVAFVKNKTLYYACGSDILQIAEDVETYSQYQNTLVFAKEGNIFCWKDNGCSLLIEVGAKYIYWLAGNDSYLAIGGSEGALYIYREGLLLQQEDIQIGGGEQFFLYKQFLVLFGEGQTGVTICDLSAGTAQALDLGWAVYGDDYVEMAVACDERNIFLSLKAVYLPDYDKTLREGTFRIDPTTWEVEKINDKFYGAILCGENGLYALDTLKLRGKKIV